MKINALSHGVEIAAKDEECNRPGKGICDQNRLTEIPQQQTDNSYHARTRNLADSKFTGTACRDESGQAKQPECRNCDSEGADPEQSILSGAELLIKSVKTFIEKPDLYGIAWIHLGPYVAYAIQDTLAGPK